MSNVFLDPSETQYILIRKELGWSLATLPYDTDEGLKQEGTGFHEGSDICALLDTAAMTLAARQRAVIEHAQLETESE